MNTRAKRIILSLIFVALTGASIRGLYKVLSWKDTSGEYFSSLAELKQLPNNTVDVAALGSSRVYGTFDVSMLWRKEGIASANLSIAGMDQESAYFHLVELLKTQSPKVVFLEGSLLYTDKYLDQGNVYRNTIVMNPSKNNLDLINGIVKEGNKADYILRFPIVHSRYKELNKGDFVISNIDNGRLGFIPGFDNIPQRDVDFNVLDNNRDYIEASEHTQEWIAALDSLAKKRGFDIIFYLAPQNMLEYYKKQYNGACKVLDEYGIVHIDFNQLRDEIGLDYSTDLSDALHANDNGSRKIMEYIHNYLIENYDFVDNRGREEYSRWDKNFAYINNERLENEISNLDTEKAIERLLEMKDVLLVECSSSRVKVCLNGNVEFETSNQSAEYHFKINDSGYCYITVLKTDDGLSTIVYFNQTPYYLHGDSENLCIAYDLVRDEVVYYKEY